MAENNIGRLRGLIAPAGADTPCCLLSNERLAELLDRYKSCELAAYHACLIMSQDDSASLPDGTALPSQRGYWLTRAAELRPNRGGALCRADEVGI